MMARKPEPNCSLTLFTPAGVVPKLAPLKLAVKRLTGLGFDLAVDAAATARHQRFGGDDLTRLDALHRVARASPSVAMATRGGYGLSRLLDRIDWRLLAQSVENGTRWVGHSDLTALHLGMLAHSKVSGWAGPMALDDWGGEVVDEVTQDCFAEAMSGELEAVGFKTEEGFGGLERRGVLWGGNLSVICTMVGTPHMPRIKNGVLFLEDVNEHPYRVERNLLHLLHAGVIDAQSAVVLGHFSHWKKSPLDRGFTLKTVVAELRARTAVPILTGLPFGHVATKVTLPVGRRVQLLVEGRQALIGW